MIWPSRGVYLFFERGEGVANDPGAAARSLDLTREHVLIVEEEA